MSSNSSSRRCRRFSLDEIEDARNCFGKSKLLGQGGEGKVYLSKVYMERRYTLVAVKHLHPSSNELDKEIQTVTKIQHPHIVSLLGYCEESGQKILIYEYMKNGSLSDYVKGKNNICLSWQQRLNICLGAARGLQHLHTVTKDYPHGIVHRDVKPGNILVDSNWVSKVSDFGLLKLSHSGQEMSTMDTDRPKGTPGYYAPEYYEFSQVNRKVDVYSFGIVLFEVLCKKMPWDRGDESYQRNDNENLGLWAEEKVDVEIKGEISVDSLKTFTDIIRRSLLRNPMERPTMDDVVHGLEKALRCQDSTMDDLALDLDKMLKYQDQEHQVDEATELRQPSGFLNTGSRHSVKEQGQRGERRARGKKNKEDPGIHTHKLVILESNKEFVCNTCQTLGSGTRLCCSPCDINLNLHEYCASRPKSQLFFVHPHTLVGAHYDECDVSYEGTIQSWGPPLVHPYGSTEDPGIHTHKLVKLESNKKFVWNTEDPGIHTHKLVKLESNKEFVCNTCKTLGSGTRQSCSSCDINLNLHEYCASCPRSQLSFVHPHTLNVVVPYNEVTHRICDVCNDHINGLFYRCSDGCDFDVHPLCTQLPLTCTHFGGRPSPSSQAPPTSFGGRPSPTAPAHSSQPPPSFEGTIQSWGPPPVHPYGSTGVPGTGSSFTSSYRVYYTNNNPYGSTGAPGGGWSYSSVVNYKPPEQ